MVEPAVLDYANTFLRKDQADCRAESIDGLEAGDYVLAAHYAERYFGDFRVPGNCDCSSVEKKYICETVVFSLTPLAGACPCAEKPCDRTCPCGAVDACGATIRGPHVCLCHWVTDAKVPGASPELCEWSGRWLDPAAGVPLGCVRVQKHTDRCKPVAVDEITDACGPRRLVKNNDLLYDLIRGCDLTRIKWISWADKHRTSARDRTDPARPVVEWKEFAAMFHESPNPDPQNPDPSSETDFAVRFSRAVKVDTIRLDAVTMTIALEENERWLGLLRVPLSKIDTTPEDATLPPDTTDQIRLFVRADWVAEEIKGAATRLSEDRLGYEPFTVEIEIRGDLILDCTGQAIDANAVGVAAAPTGNGTPGGTFVSSFDVQARPSRKRKP